MFDPQFTLGMRKCIGSNGMILSTSRQGQLGTSNEWAQLIWRPINF